MTTTTSQFAPRISDPRTLLAIRAIRHLLDQAARDGKQYITSYQRPLEFWPQRRRRTPQSCRDRSMKRLASRETVAAAIEILRDRQCRREMAQRPDSLAEAVTPRLAAQLRERREQVMRLVALEVADQISETIDTPLVQSERAEVCYGMSDHEEKCWPYKGAHKNRPAVWRNAGVTVGWQGARPCALTVYTSRGVEFGCAIPRRAWELVWPVRGSERDHDRRIDRAAQIIAGTTTREQLDAWAEQDDEDRVSIASPTMYVVCDSRRHRDRNVQGLIVADTRDKHRIVQVVVRDSTTGLRHHITVPPKFGRPLDRGEKAADRVRAALAWSFGVSAREYAPDVAA